VKGFVSLMLKKECVTRALKVSFLVGSVLALINHYPSILSGTVSAAELLQILITYAVPYCVSSYSSAAHESYLKSLELEPIHD
jgi:hypothetical protein